MATDIERLLKLFPAFLAGGLALVYVLGAIVTGSEFAGAGINPSDGVPLLSVEQVLARGIGVLAQPDALKIGAYVLFFLGSAIAVHLLNQHFERSRKERSTLSLGSGTARKDQVEARRNQRIKQLFAYQSYLTGTIALVGLLFVPIERLPGGIAILVVPVAIFLISRTADPRRWMPMVFIVMMIGYLVGLGLSAYADPAQLPPVELRLMSDRKLSGLFVTHSDSTWYLYTKQMEAIQAFPDESVRRAKIGKRPDDPGDGKRLSTIVLEQLESIAPAL